MWAEKVKTSRRGSEKGLKGFGAASKKESTTTDNAASAEPSAKIEMAKGGEDAAEGVGVWAEKLRTTASAWNRMERSSGPPLTRRSTQTGGEMANSPGRRPPPTRCRRTEGTEACCAHTRRPSWPPLLAPTPPRRAGSGSGAARGGGRDPGGARVGLCLLLLRRGARCRGPGGAGSGTGGGGC